MNRTQRSLLVFFAFVILLSSSYSESSSLRYFLSTTLLFFSLSPASWFTKIQAINYASSANQKSSTEELLSETDDFLIGYSRVQRAEGRQKTSFEIVDIFVDLEKQMPIIKVLNETAPSVLWDSDLL